VSLRPDSIPHDVPQILINREQLPHLNFDVELLGDCDVIVNELCHRLGGDFEQLCDNTLRLVEITEKPPRLPDAAAGTTTTTTNSVSGETTTAVTTTQAGADSIVTPAMPSEEMEVDKVTEAPAAATTEAPAAAITEAPANATTEALAATTTEEAPATAITEAPATDITEAPANATTEALAAATTEEAPVAAITEAPATDITATPATADHVLPEPCPVATQPDEVPTTTTESSEAPTEDTPKDEAAKAKRQDSNLELRRRCWMSRLNRSPISKRLESKFEIV